MICKQFIPSYQDCPNIIILRHYVFRLYPIKISRPNTQAEESAKERIGLKWKISKPSMLLRLFTWERPEWQIDICLHRSCISTCFQRFGMVADTPWSICYWFFNSRWPLTCIITENMKKLRFSEISAGPKSSDSALSPELRLWPGSSSYLLSADPKHHIYCGPAGCFIF